MLGYKRVVLLRNLSFFHKSQGVLLNPFVQSLPPPPQKKKRMIREGSEQ